MKIKYRIAILFTLLVTAILLLLFVSIYYFSGLNRQNECRKRLKNRALTTVNLLIKVPGINADLLRKIDESTFLVLQQKSVIVYNYEDKLLYNYADENTIPVRLNRDILEQVKNKGENYFTENKKDIVALVYTDKTNKYVVVSAAYDKDGFEKLEELKWVLIFSFFTGSLFTFIAGLIFSIRLVAPIKKITKEVKETQMNRRMN